MSGGFLRMNSRRLVRPPSVMILDQRRYADGHVNPLKTIASMTPPRKGFDARIRDPAPVDAIRPSLQSRRSNHGSLTIGLASIVSRQLDSTGSWHFTLVEPKRDVFLGLEDGRYSGDDSGQRISGLVVVGDREP